MSLTITLSRRKSDTRYWWFKLGFIGQSRTSWAIVGYVMGMVVGSPFLAVETMSLMPRFTQDASYSAMTEFLSMGLDNFGPDEFKQASFKE
jgi:hypothetical protein